VTARPESKHSNVAGFDVSAATANPAHAVRAVPSINPNTSNTASPQDPFAHNCQVRTSILISVSSPGSNTTLPVSASGAELCGSAGRSTQSGSAIVIG